MERAEYFNFFENESTHFYYRALHDTVLRAVSQVFPSGKRILDVGCGTGGLAEILKRKNEVEAIDASSVACELAEQRGLHPAQASVTEIPFPDASFDVVTCIDVLYHSQVSDERTALKEINRVLKPGGLLVLRVPAHPWLLSRHDQHVHTRTRFTRENIRGLLESEGFRIERLSFLGVLLFFVAALKKMKEVLFPQAETETSVKPVSPRLNRFLEKILTWDGRLALRWGLPVGLGILAIARKQINASGAKAAPTPVSPAG